MKSAERLWYCDLQMEPEVQRQGKDSERGGHQAEAGVPGDAWFYLPPLLALVVFIIYLVQIRAEPFFKYLVANPLVYDSEARQLLQGIPHGQPFFLSALYPTFVALLYRLSGGSQTALMVAQGLLASANVYLVGEIARRTLTRPAALVAALIMVFYWSFYYFAGEMVPAILSLIFMLTGMLLFLARDDTRPSRLRYPVIVLAAALSLMYALPGLGRLGGLVRSAASNQPATHYLAGVAFFLVLAAGAVACIMGLPKLSRLRGTENTLAGGIALGVGTLAWSGAAVLAALFTAWLARRRSSRLQASVLVAAFLVPVAASTAYNALVSGDFIPVTSSFGVNFFLGNNAASDGMDPFRFGEGNKIRIEADKLRLSGKQRSDFFTRQAIDFIRGQPAKWLRLEGRKLLIWLNKAQVNNNADIAERRSAWKRLFIPRLHFGVIFPLACAGVVGILSRRRQALILVLGFVCFLAVPLVFFSCERFRLPAVALLIPIAAYGAETVIRYAASRRFARLLLVVVASAAAGLVSNLDPAGIFAKEMPSIVANKAYVQRLAGNAEEAERLARRALQMDPKNAGAFFQLGAIEEAKGDTLQALTHYLDCLEGDVFFAASYEAVGKILDRKRISRSYLDAYVDGLLAGQATIGKSEIIEFVRKRLP